MSGTFKILHIIPNLKKGGAERLVIDMVQELNKQKNVEAHIVLLHSEIEYDISAIKNYVRVVQASVELSLWKKNKINVSKLQKFIETLRPSIIHSHLFEAERISRYCLYPKAKWFSHGHGFFKEFTPQPFFSLKNIVYNYENYHLFRQYKKNGGTQFIAISEAIKKFLERKVKKEVLVLPNAIKISNFIQRTRKHPGNNIKLISVGRFDKNKNQRLQILILKKLLKSGMQVQLDLFGSGQELKNVKEFARDQKLNPYVTFHGQVNYIEKIYSNYDILIHTAKKEAMGLVLIEAMASGLPIVSLDGIGNRNIVINGENGFLVETENINSFVSFIKQIYQNNELYIKMSENARKSSEKLDILYYCEKLLNIYQS